jgi:hypothetical protein
MVMVDVQMALVFCIPLLLRSIKTVGKTLINRWQMGLPPRTYRQGKAKN